MRERAEAEARKKRLESLAGKENELWATADRLIATKQPRRYDEAVSLLHDLHDLAELQGKGPDFKFRMGALQRKNSGKSSLMERFRKAKFLGGENGDRLVFRESSQRMTPESELQRKDRKDD